MQRPPVRMAQRRDGSILNHSMSRTLPGTTSSGRHKPGAGNQNLGKGPNVFETASLQQLECQNAWVPGL